MPSDFRGPLNVDPLRPRDIHSLLGAGPFQWWIAGGWALDLFIGEQSRPHFDTDVAVGRQDQTLVQEHLPGWDFQYAVPGTSGPVIFKTWKQGEILGREIPGSWARESLASPWRFEFILHEIGQGVWSFRYCPAVQHPVQQLGGCTAGGIPYLQPEIALLHKAARLREVDEQDFRRVLPALANAQRLQLAKDIRSFSPEHPWLGPLG